MSAPKRWLDDPGSTSGVERDLLRAGLSVDPPPGAQGEVWAALLSKLPPPGGGPPGDGGGSTAAGKAASAGKAAVAAKASGAGAVAAGAGILKSALIGAGSAVVLIAGYSAVAPSTPDPLPPPAVVAPPADPPPLAAPAPLRAAVAPSVTASAVPSAEPAAPRHVAVDPRPAVSATASATVEPAAAAAERETMLREESRMVAEARDALRRGDAGGALTMLEQIRAKFPGGVLAQEREALSIEALARSGRKGDAAARAAAFVKAYPTSPLAARVQQFAN
ncbi:MAG: hypothetical protein QM820_50455 [Minicystis sp.]